MSYYEEEATEGKLPLSVIAFNIAALVLCAGFVLLAANSLCGKCLL